MGNKITASFILGACGDSLGAPVEGLFSLEKIKKHYGEDGVSLLTGYESPFEKGQTHAAGEITDDTTMAMTTAAALIKALEESTYPSPEFSQKLRHYSWQGYLHWAAAQTYTPEPSRHIDPSIAWSKLARDFWFATGAGRGTLAALMQDRPGSLENPLHYTCEIRGATVSSPNQGCGAMMRVAPLAFLPALSATHLFDLAVENAAITHSGQDACVAAGAVALLVHHALQDLSADDMLARTAHVLHHYRHHPLLADGVARVCEALQYTQALADPFTTDTIDSLPARLGYPGKRAFLAIPVLAQVAFTLRHATTVETVKHALIRSANHSGDSDSVASIAGQILGARFGHNAIPDEWSTALLQKTQLEAMADALENTLQNNKIHFPAPK